MRTNIQHVHQAEFWRRLDAKRVECELCPHHCRINEGQAGRCRVRGVSGGELKALGYGLLSSAHVDPVEKKPLYHFHPGASIFSIGGWGCNLGCVFCQNWSISQEFRTGSTVHSPGKVVQAMKSQKSALVAYTYNEPFVGYEFVKDCCRLVREADGKNVLVTNGYVEEGPATGLLPLVDALNVDIKSMDDAFYRKYCKATLPPVLRFCQQAVKAGCHVEITNLIIPGLNDTDEGFTALSEWIRNNLGPLVPLHLSAYHPDYHMDSPVTPVPTLRRAWEICRRSLTYVYMGNVSVEVGQDTVCPGCGAMLIERRGYATRLVRLHDGLCSGCGRRADVVG